jgi:hypothetical protein
MESPAQVARAIRLGVRPTCERSWRTRLLSSTYSASPPAVDAAVAQGALVFPYRKDDTAATFAAKMNAALADGSDPTGRSLSPVRLSTLQRGDGVVLSSTKGSTCAAIAAALVRRASAILRLSPGFRETRAAAWLSSPVASDGPTGRAASARGSNRRWRGRFSVGRVSISRGRSSRGAIGWFRARCRAPAGHSVGSGTRGTGSVGRPHVRLRGQHHLDLLRDTSRGNSRLVAGHRRHIHNVPRDRVMDGPHDLHASDFGGRD